MSSTITNLFEKPCEYYILENGDCIGCRFLKETEDFYVCEAGFIIEARVDLGADLDYIERIDETE